jgi:endoglucanase
LSRTHATRAPTAFLITATMTFVAAAVAVAPCRAGVVYTGVNLAGAEFGQTSLPGTYGTHYTYPTAAEVDYYVGKGMNTFRLPIRWERLQQSQNAALNAAELGRLNTFVNYATGKGAHVIIEPHNFARYYPGTNYQTSTTGVIGSAAVPNASFADFWSRVATQYRTNDKVIFNLMNEPANVNTDQWVGSANAAIAAIRAAGANNLILVPGTRWTGAWTWNNADAWGRSNAAAMLDIVDPLAVDNLAFDVHQYLDNDGSGTSTQIGTNANPDNTDIGVQRLTAFTNWLHANGRRGFLGEFAVANSRIGGGSTQVGDETLVKMLDYVEAHDDVWLGWAWWAGGPWWGEYMFTLDPTNVGLANQGSDRAAMGVLQPYAVGVPEPGAMTAIICVACAGVLARRGRR